MIFQRGRDLSLRRTILLSFDIIGLVAGMALAAFWRLGPREALFYLHQNRFALIASLLVFLIVFYASGMYERAALIRRAHSYRLPAISVLLSISIISAIFYANADLKLGRGVLFIAAAFVFIFSWATRHVYSMAAGYGLLSKKALLVGEGRDAERALSLIKGTADSGIKILGVVASNKVPSGTFMLDVPVVGSVDKLKELVDAFDVESIIVATSLSREASLLRQLRPLRCSGVEIMDYVTVYELLAQEIPLDHINDEWLMSAALNSSVIHIRKIKRIMDFFVASLGLILASPICLVVAPLIKFDSPGPVLYRQRRSGKDGHPYMLMKFRTMCQDAEAKTGAVWSSSKDNRITRIGYFLRKWRIDEIPQLVNVLRGEMSLVGPRPERPEFVETLSSAIPFYQERLMVPPGVTGWAQVKFPYASNVDGARRKLQFDLYYIKHMGFMLDTLILLRTVKTIIVGLRHSDHEQKPDALDTTVLTVLPTAEADKSSIKSA